MTETHVTELPDAELFKHLNSAQMAGWFVRKANFAGADKLALDADGCLAGDGPDAE